MEEKCSSKEEEELKNSAFPWIRPVAHPKARGSRKTFERTHENGFSVSETSES